MMKVLVTNAKNRIAYNIVRSLAAKGVDVYCADFMPRAMSFYSKYSAGHFVYPSPFSDQKRFIKCLISKIKELKIDILMPVFEELFLISRHREELSKHVKMVVPEYSQVMLLHNKDRWEPIAAQLKIAVPKTFDIEHLVAAPEHLAELAFPVLIKPKQGGGGWGIKKVESAGEFRTLMMAGAHEGLPWERFFVQEWIEGHTVCVAMVLCHGRLRGKVTYRQIREYPAFGGQATCRISISNGTAEDNLQRLLEHLGWHGVCQADFVVDKKTKCPYLIDINPRFWGSLAQAIASGVDFPGLVYQIALDGDVSPVTSFQQGVMTRWLGGELRGFAQHYSQADAKIDFLHRFLFPRVKTTLYDDFSLKDPVPFFAWGADALHRLSKFGGLKPHESLAGVWE